MGTGKWVLSPPRPLKVYPYHKLYRYTHTHKGIVFEQLWSEVVCVLSTGMKSEGVLCLIV